MKRALRFRRRLTVAGICVLGILFLAFYSAFRSVAQSEDLNHWVAHTQEVLGYSAQARLNRARLENEPSGYREARVSGHDVLRAIKADERTRSIPVVVLTSSNQERDLLESYQFGVYSYIQKSVDLQKFQETVHHFGLYWLLVNHAAPPAAFTVKNPRTD